MSRQHSVLLGTRNTLSDEKGEINVPMTLSVFRDGHSIYRHEELYIGTMRPLGSLEMHLQPRRTLTVHHEHSIQSQHSIYRHEELYICTMRPLGSFETHQSPRRTLTGHHAHSAPLQKCYLSSRRTLTDSMQSLSYTASWSRPPFERRASHGTSLRAKLVKFVCLFVGLFHCLTSS